MGISKYPRPGQRIAPATLAEILDVPLPPEFGYLAAGRFKKLADLDESVWQHASVKACRNLANLVLHQVKQNLTRVKGKPLPQLLQPILPSDLDIEVRTFNCLKRRFRQDLCSLNKLSICDLMPQANFGVHTLVDLLVSLESVAANPKPFDQLELEIVSAADPDPIPASELPSEFRVELSRFPRKGHRIAPRTLAHILDVPVQNWRIGGVKLLDLDESVWEKFEPETCRKLAAKVICRVKQFRSALRGRFGRTRLPMPRTKGKPAVLQLQQRTFNCLNAAGMLHEPELLAKTTFSELFAMPNFGDTCLVDLLCALESQLGSSHRTSQEVIVAAQRLAKLKEVATIRPNDPRLGLMIQSLGVPGENLKQIAEEIARSITCPSPPHLCARRLDEILVKIRASRQLRLEDELGELLSFEPRPRNRELAAAYFGWAGKGTHTLEEVGSWYGMTRERVRQITQRLVETLKAKRPYLPVLDRVLQAIADEIPCSVGRIESMLAERNLSRAGFRFGGVISAAEMTDRCCPFVIEDADGMQYAVPCEQEGVAKTVLQLARKSISRWGAATIEDIAAQVSEDVNQDISTKFVKAVLCTQPGFSWLDEPSGWFWLKSTTRNALLNQIRKVIAVAPRVHISELRAGVSRPHRREGFAPPQRVLIALCAQAGGYDIEGDSVLARPPLNHREVLSDTESIIVDVLCEHGPVMRKPKLEELCLRKGLHRDSFSIHLTYSPVIARYAPGVYGLRGAQVPPGLAESMVQLRRKTRVLADYGWLPDGRIFVSYKLSEGCLSNGIVSVPSGMRSYLQGEFKLLIADGQSAGRLAVKDNSAWGLGPFFRRRGGEPGDHFQIIFDTKQRLASVHLGETMDDEKDS